MFRILALPLILTCTILLGLSWLLVLITEVPHELARLLHKMIVAIGDTVVDWTGPRIN